DPTAGDNFAIQAACSNGHTETVEILLKDGRADPKANNSFALWMAAQNGYLQICQLLLQDMRVDLFAKTDDMTALEIAVENDQMEVSQLLLHASRTLSQKSSKTLLGEEKFKPKVMVETISEDISGNA